MATEISEFSSTGTEPEISRQVALCDGAGNLNPAAIGWSRNPLHDCNLRGHRFRKKRWNAWGAQSDTHYFITAIFDLDYFGYAFGWLLDLRTLEAATFASIAPLARSCRLSDNVQGECRFAAGSTELQYLQSEHESRLSGHAATRDGRTMAIDLAIDYPPGQETLGVVIPWSQRVFHYTGKHTSLPVNGAVRVGDMVAEFEPGQGGAWLDFARGVFPYRTHWEWAVSSTVQAGRRIGFNLGGAWTDGTGMTENALYLDGRLHKIHDDVTFEIDRADYRRPWRIHTRKSDRVDLTFTPLFERREITNLFVVRSRLHQLVGRVDGTIVADDGEQIKLAGAITATEDHFARW
jgi:hypothetical protein